MIYESRLKSETPSQCPGLDPRGLCPSLTAIAFRQDVNFNITFPDPVTHAGSGVSIKQCIG
jgi:hypothetical protein